MEQGEQEEQCPFRACERGKCQEQASHHQDRWRRCPLLGVSCTPQIDTHHSQEEQCVERRLQSPTTCTMDQQTLARGQEQRCDQTPAWSEQTRP